jgi:hypothetical protein
MHLNIVKVLNAAMAFRLQGAWKTSNPPGAQDLSLERVRTIFLCLRNISCHPHGLNTVVHSHRLEMWFTVDLACPGDCRPGHLFEETLVVTINDDGDASPHAYLRIRSRLCHVTDSDPCGCRSPALSIKINIFLDVRRHWRAR